jgi:hypothetical protein
MHKKELVYHKYLDIEDFIPESRQAIIEYICHLCNGIVKHPLIDNCALGHIFCKECLYTRLTESNLCPISHEELNRAKFSEIKLVSNIIEKQTVYCKNRIYNCNWIGSLTRLENHLQLECEKTQVLCPNISCDFRDFKENLAGHLLRCEFRVIQCSNCHVNIQFNILKSHLNECPKVEINCPKQCGKVIYRCELNEHIENYCDNTIVYCPFYSYGCVNSILRKNLGEHNFKGNIEHHLIFINSIEKSNYDLINKISNVEKNHNQYIEVMKNTEIAYEKIIEKFNSFYNTKLKEEEELETSSLKNKRVRNEDLENQSFETVKKRKLKKCSQILDVDLFPKEKTEENVNKKIEKEKTPKRTENKNPIDEERTEKILKKVNEYEKLIFDTKKSDLQVKSAINSFSIDKSSTYSIDMVNISKGLNTNMLTVTCSSDSVNRYHFAFLNINVQNSDFKWRLKLNIASSWMGFGLCKKENVIINKYKFASSRHGFDHASFIISINGYLWNSNNKFENDKEIKNFPSLNKGEEVSLFYSSNTNELNFKLRHYEWKLSNVSSPNTCQLVPCVVFLHKGDEATFLIDSKRL